MEDFCGNSSFWVWYFKRVNEQLHANHHSLIIYLPCMQDDYVTWNTTKPDFTPCFEQTVLVWGPTAFLFFLATFDFASRLRSKGRHIPASILLIAKTVGVWALIILHTVHLSLTFRLEGDDKYEFYKAERYSTIVRIAAYILVFLLMVLHKTKGVRTSGLLFYYWFFSMLCDVFPFQTALRNPPDVISVCV